MNFENINQATNEVAESAHKLWLAGLGAVSRVRSNGEKIFADLVAEGTRFERATRKDVKASVTRLRKQADRRVSAVKKETSGRWNRLEKAFEDRVAGALERLDVPTRGGIERLERQVEKLAREVKALETTPRRKA